MPRTRTTQPGGRSIATLPPQPAYKGFFVRGTTTMGAAGNDTTRTVVLPTHQTGDLLVISLHHWNNGTDTITTATGWTALPASMPSNNNATWVFYKVATSSAETNPVIGNGNLQNYGLVCASLAGVDATTPVATFAWNARVTGQTSLASFPIVTYAPNQIIITSFHAFSDNASSYTMTTASPGTTIVNLTTGTQQQAASFQYMLVPDPQSQSAPLNATASTACSGQAYSLVLNRGTA